MERSILFVAHSPNEVCATSEWNSTWKISAGYTSSSSSAYNRLTYPADLKYDGYGYLYVADTNNHRIMRFPNGTSSFYQYYFKFSFSIGF